MTKKDYATQIWPFREDFGKDMPTTLEKLAEMGFTGVELCRWFDWTDMFDKWSAEELRDVAQRVGIKIMSTHVPSYMLQPERLDDLAQFCDIVGMKYVMVASLPPEQMASKAILLGMAESFNQAATILNPKGFKLDFTLTARISNPLKVPSPGKSCLIIPVQKLSCKWISATA